MLNIIAGDVNGGAGRGACWLHLGLKNFGFDLKILQTAK